MSNIDLYKGVIDKARENFNHKELDIFFSRDLSQFDSKDDKKFDISVFKPFEENSAEDTVV